MQHHLASVGEAEAVGGTFTIANEVIAQIVGLTVLECYGVVGMAASSLTQGVYRLLSRERVDQGVTVHHEPAGLVIELYIVVEYGLNLAEVAGNVRSAGAVSGGEAHADASRLDPDLHPRGKAHSVTDGQ